MSDLTPERLDALTKRLRGWDHCWPAPWLETATIEAADAITALRAEVERLTRERDTLNALLLCERAKWEAADTRANAAEADAAAARKQVQKLRDETRGNWRLIQRVVEWAERHGKEPEWLEDARAALQGEG